MSEADAAVWRRRDEKRKEMHRHMLEALADAEELARLMEAHPRPWTWRVGFHDHLFYQFIDANGAPCLGNDLTSAEDAAFLFTLINQR